MLGWALRYISLGWAVFPLGVGSKMPMISKEQGGRGYLDATLNETQVRAWWANWPRANIGIATGHAFFVVDIDPRHGGDETWDMLRMQQPDALPDTLEQTTGGGGRQIFYATPAAFAVKCSVGEFGPGIDIRGEGGYIVAPPSVHPETKREYGWEGLKELEEEPLAPAPVWVLKRLQEIGKKPEGSRAPPIRAKIPHGYLHNTLVSLAGTLRARGLSAEEMFPALMAVNRERSEQPATEAYVRKVAESVAQYPAGKLLPRRERMGDEENGELPLGAADIEAAVQACIEHDDLIAVLEMAGDIAKLDDVRQLVVRTKVIQKFGQRREFSAAAYDKAVRSKRKVVEILTPLDEPPVDTGLDLLPFPHTDSGNGERIVRMFGSDIRYCLEMAAWLVWDGRRWEVDVRGVVSQMAKKMARRLHEQAVGQPNQSGIEQWARKSESQAGIVAALKRAATEPGVPAAAGELDQHPYLLNCLNGVIDLRSGELLAHDRGYLITKLCHVAYDPKARCDRFLRFLHWAMGDANPESGELPARVVHLVAFLQRAFGYALTADVSEKSLFVFWGPRGNNGKTTLLNTFRGVLGEYSTQITIETLMQARGSADAGLRADLADLRGARFVTTSEVEKESKLSEGTLKRVISGGGKLKVCRKYENPHETDETWKIFMDCNYRPKVTGADKAIWRRLKAIPFELSIEENDAEFDKLLHEKLRAEWPGILAWAVRGCQRWKQDGLGDPPEISAANQEWREHDDPLREFLEDACQEDKEAWVPSARLFAVYQWWAKQHGERWPLGREYFKERLESKGFEYTRRRDSLGKQFRCWVGVRLLDAVEAEMEAARSYPKSLERD